MSNDKKKVAIIGAGTMGHGIALVWALGGFAVSLMDISQKILKGALDSISAELSTLVKSGIISDKKSKDAYQRIRVTTDLREAVDRAEFVTESVVENLELKKKIFSELDHLCQKDVILASNTSSFSITEIASSTKNRERVLGTHWWNPPYLMPLVEIVKGTETSEEVAERTKALILKLGKMPVYCKDRPGFVGVRLQAALVIEAIRILEEGTATAEDIDTAVTMTLGFRLPVIGPLQIVDLGGMDVFLNAYDYLYQKLGDRFRPPRLLREKVKAGELGIKTSSGFYRYSPEIIKELTRRRDEWIIKHLKEIGLRHKDPTNF